MRNLKRALSLAMASVMLLGMMVVGTSAKGMDDFSDAAEIANQDAVAVTSEIGIFDGYDDGEFKPENVVTRAEMAVIICKMLYGADVEVAQFAETKVFTDAPAWAEGYVNLCASLGIVAGVGDNKFDPNSTVTTAQAAMMLTKALGYFQNARDFGDNWVLAATAKATELGLYGDLKLTAAAGLTRENVAVLVFNALTKAVPVQYNELLGVYYNENQGIIYSLEFNYLQTLGYKNFDLVYKTNTETIYGRPATTWGFGTYKTTTSSNDSRYTEDLTEAGGLIASKVRMLDKDEIVTVANVPTYVYTSNTKNKDVYKDLGKSVCTEYAEVNDKDNDGYFWTAYVNGEEQDDAFLPIYKDETGANARKAGDKYEYTNKGTVTEIYIDDADRTVTVVEINNYIGQVSKVKEKDDETVITVNELNGASDLDTKTFVTDAFAEDDYVIFTVDYDEDDDKFVIGEVFAPETVQGEVTRVQNDKDDDTTYLRLADGTKYPYSYYGDTEAQQSHMVYDLNELTKDPVHPTLNEEYVLYMDPNGYVVGFALVDETELKYLYVKDSDEEMGDWRAKVLLADGTTTTVDVKDEVKSYEKTNNGYKIAWIDDDNNTNNNQDVKIKTNIDEKVFTYTVSESGVYTLRNVPHKVELNDNADIHNGKAYITVGDNDFIVDKKTVFVDDMNDVAYIGYKEVPNVENSDIAYAKIEGVLDIVFILNGDIYDSNSTYFMLLDDERESLNKDEDFHAYQNAYVNGEEQDELIVAYDAWTSYPLVAGKLYKALKTNADGYITEVEEVELSYNPVKAVGDDAFWITNAKDKKVKFDVADDTVWVLVEYDEDGDIVDIDEAGINEMFKGEDEDGFVTYVDVVKKSDETAKLVYIHYMEPADKPADKIDTRTLSVEGNATITFNGFTGTSLEITDTEAGDVIVKAAAGYTIADVTCDAATKIVAKANGEWTVTIPAGEDDVVIVVDDSEDTYAVTYAQASWGYNVVKGENTLGTNSTMEVKLECKQAGNTSVNIQVTGATANLTKNPGTDTVWGEVNLGSEAEFKLAQKLGIDGKLYGTVGEVVDTYAGQTTLWYIEEAATAATWTGTISNATGPVTVTMVAP